MAEPILDYEALSDADLAAFAAAGNGRAAALITTRNNQRLYRTAWSILKNRGEAEEAVQEAYLKAFTGRARFDGRSALSTWLTRIVVNEALERKRAAQRHKRNFAAANVALMDEYRERLAGAGAPNPENAVIRAQISKLLELAIAQLPDEFRTVFILREIEGLSVEETAEVLALTPQTVKTRLFRARRRLRQGLDPEMQSALGDTFRFAGADCAGMTQRTLAALGLMEKGNKHD